MAREKGFAILPVLILVVLLAGIGGGMYLIRHPQILKSGASFFLKCNSLYVQVSADKLTWSDSINLPSTATKYYLLARKAQDKTTPCSTNFDAGSPDDTKVTSPWGQYKSGPDGIARIDLVGVKPGTYSAKFRPHKGDEWSNVITVEVGGTSAFAALAERNQPQPQPFNLADYLIYKPGYTWLYISKNNLTNKIGTTRLQIEQETNWCDVIIHPWRFTKSIVDAYWAPGQDRNLRWMLAAPNFKNRELPDYDNYFWAYGDKKYQILNSDSLKDINLDPKAFLIGYVYTSTNPKLPAYNLAPKSMTGSYAVNQDGSSHYISITPQTCQSSLTPSGLEGKGSWRVRIDADKVDINNPNFKYSGEALRIDYYEGRANILTDKNLLRESWYFVKDIGLVKIVEKTFNGYKDQDLDCAADSDCLNDDILSPHSEMTLDQYFQNPTFTNITVGAYDGLSCSNFSKSVTVSKQQGYCLKLGEVPFTGYLEARTLSTSNNNKESRPFKWLWADNGIVKVDSSKTSELSEGRYDTQFRIWIPNEDFPGEKRVNPVDLLWSNTVTVNLVSSLSPTPAPTSTPRPTATPIQTSTSTPTPTPTPTPAPVVTLTPAPSPTAYLPGGSIEGPASGTVGQALQYSAKSDSKQGQGYISLHWAKATDDVTQGSAWHQITKSELQCWTYSVFGLECTIAGSFTPSEAGTYYVAVVVTDKGAQCSGNPKYYLLPNWKDCGPNDLITVTVK